MFIDVLVDEQHPTAVGQQTTQRVPERVEPARRYVREPRREEDDVEPGVRLPREHVGHLEADVARPHPGTGDPHRLGCRVDRRHRVGQFRQRFGPQAGAAGDLEHASGRTHLRDQSRDARTGRRDVAVRGRVVLARPATVVVDLIRQHLVGHPDIITHRAARGRYGMTT